MCGFIDDREEAKNIAQDIFLHLWEHRNRLNTIENLNAYLFILSRNAAFKALKRRYVMVPTDEALNCAGDNKADTDAFLDETLRIIEAVISAMPQRRREIFLMSRQQGMSNDEIAAYCGISKNTVESHITSALANIRKSLIISALLLFDIY